MIRAGVIAILTVVFTAALFARGADAQKDAESLRQQIEELEKQESSAREIMDRSGRQEKGVLEEIEDLDKRLSGARRRAALLRELEGSLKIAASRSKTRIGDIVRERDRTARDLALRSVALYKASSVSYVKLILDSKGIEDLQRRQYFLKVLARHDSGLFSRAAQLLGEEQRQMASLEKDQNELDSALSELAAAARMLEEARRARSAALARIRNEKDRQARLLKELAGSAQELKSFLETLEKDTAAGSTFPALKGTLPRPVAGKIVVDFGKNRSDRFNTYTLSRGISIQSAEGTPVRSVHKGRVIYADWFRGFGRIVIVDHGGNYYTLYGHLSSMEVAVGQEIEAKQVIGRVGESGFVEGPSLYFEIRHRGSALDPKPWFAAG